MTARATAPNRSKARSPRNVAASGTTLRRAASAVPSEVAGPISGRAAEFSELLRGYARNEFAGRKGEALGAFVNRALACREMSNAHAADSIPLLDLDRTLLLAILELGAIVRAAARKEFAWSEACARIAEVPTAAELECEAQHATFARVAPLDYVALADLVARRELAFSDFRAQVRGFFPTVAESESPQSVAALGSIEAHFRETMQRGSPANLTLAARALAGGDGIGAIRAMERGPAKSEGKQLESPEGRAAFSTFEKLAAIRRARSEGADPFSAALEILATVDFVAIERGHREAAREDKARAARRGSKEGRPARLGPAQRAAILQAAESLWAGNKALRKSAQKTADALLKSIARGGPLAEIADLAVETVARVLRGAPGYHRRKNSSTKV